MRNYKREERIENIVKELFGDAEEQIEIVLREFIDLSKEKKLEITIKEKTRNIKVCKNGKKQKN